MLRLSVQVISLNLTGMTLRGVSVGSGRERRSIVKVCLDSSP